MKRILILALWTYAFSVQPTSALAGPVWFEQATEQQQESANPPPESQPAPDQPQSQPPETPPQAEPAAPAQAPEQSPTPNPDQGTPAQPQEPTPSTNCSKPAPTTPSPAACPKKAKKKAKRNSKPSRVIVREGGTSEPASQLAPGMSDEQARRSRQNTDQLLVASQKNLDRASGRTLSSSEQAMVEQIKVFIDQANAALKVGDFRRGHNLATKAHALSEDLLRQ